MKNIIEEKEIIEDILGTFNGQHFVSEEGVEYVISSNYVSKSCLVNGDKLRLQITSDGELIYKQIKLIDRKGLIGTLHKSEKGFYIETEEGIFKIISASSSYMKASEGDKAIVMVPRDLKTEFGALKAIIKRFNN